MRGSPFGFWDLCPSQAHRWLVASNSAPGDLPPPAAVGVHKGWVELVLCAFHWVESWVRLPAGPWRRGREPSCGVTPVCLGFLQVSLLGSPASSHSEGSDSGLSESEESVFSGLEDSGSDDMEEEDEENMGQGGASVEGGPGRLAQVGEQPWCGGWPWAAGTGG